MCELTFAGAPARPSALANTWRSWLHSGVILASGDHPVVALQQATSTVPIIFAMVADPVGAGFVESLAHPGRNTTGFTLYEYSTTAKWPELLKEIAPGVKRVAVIREAGTAAGTGQFTGVQAGVPGLGLELSPIGVRDLGEMERAVAAFSRSPNGGMIVTGSAQAAVHRDLIVTLAARHKLPTVYVARFFVTAGGLISYGPDFLDEHRRAAGYVDRDCTAGQSSQSSRSRRPGQRVAGCDQHTWPKFDARESK
jgi:putative ABC transport system substrate-binding protein